MGPVQKSRERVEGGFERVAGVQADVLVCSRGGGGMLKERMALARELWAAGIRAHFLQAASPSLTAFYEFAHAHRITWLAMIERSTFTAAATVKVGRLPRSAAALQAQAQLRVCPGAESRSCGSQPQSTGCSYARVRRHAHGAARLTWVHSAAFWAGEKFGAPNRGGAAVFRGGTLPGQSLEQQN